MNMVVEILQTGQTNIEILFLRTISYSLCAKNTNNTSFEI